MPAVKRKPTSPPRPPRFRPSEHGQASPDGKRVRLVRLTEANIRNGHLYLTGHLGFFPAECFGPSTRRKGLGRLLTIQVEGLPEVVQTDIPLNAEGTRPRPFFRDREWVRRFYAANGLAAGDLVVLEKLDRFSLRVSPWRAPVESEKPPPSPKRRRGTTALRKGEDVRRELLDRFAPKPGIPRTERSRPREPLPDGRERTQASDWSRFTFIDLFAGIGGIRLAFERVGGRCLFSSEWDEAAQRTYAANFGEMPHGDITQIDPRAIPCHDVLLAGFPCQPFSIIGDRKGFADTRGTLFFSIEQILEAKRPPAVLLENVRQFKTHDSGRTFATVIERLNDLGYFTHTAVLNALHYGVPQLRQRTFIVGLLDDMAFDFPRPLSAIPDLAAVLQPDNEIEDRLWASDRIRIKRLARVREQEMEPFYPSMWHENKGGFIGVHPFSCALRHNASHNYLLVNGVRRPSPRECLRLQGFPDSFKIVVPYREIRAQAGNSVAVPVVEAVARSMIASLKTGKPARRQDLLFSP